MPYVWVAFILSGHGMQPRVGITSMKRGHKRVRNAIFRLRVLIEDNAQTRLSSQQFVGLMRLQAPAISRHNVWHHRFARRRTIDAEDNAREIQWLLD